MECFICQAKSTKLDPTGDHQRLACPECGEYKISNTALDLMKKNKLRFNVDIARDWLRRHQGSGEIPLINDIIAGNLV
ncbi:hypothetical protein [Pseudomonas palmensis]|uniref:hypothetical protein n=1 Tax=Pseudomonas palmensis TaxID=2815362 RepID=UPI001AEAB853|nr:hypothetical protein [Pseudomonas palmensis]